MSDESSNSSVPAGRFYFSGIEFFWPLAAPLHGVRILERDHWKITEDDPFQFVDRLRWRAQKLEIGNNCWIGHHSIIDSSNGMNIGAGVQIAGLNGIYSL
jgi:hypothetical protein